MDCGTILDQRKELSKLKHLAGDVVKSAL